MNIALTGCSGGGKSTLLRELARRGVRTFEEPGRLVVRRALRGEPGGALPDEDPLGFVAACLTVSQAQLRKAGAAAGACVFDRTPLDHVGWLQRRGIGPPSGLEETVAAADYHPLAVFAPPWPELFAGDAERRHGLKAALAESATLRDDYRRAGFDLLDLPRLPVAERAVWLLGHHPALAGRAAGADRRKALQRRPRSAP